MQQHKQTTRPKGVGGGGGGIGKFCAPLEAMVMVTAFLLALLQLAHRKQGGELDHIKGGVVMMVNTMHQHKRINNKTKSGWVVLAHLQR